jgi:hypothetical protein
MSLLVPVVGIIQQPGCLLLQSAGVGGERCNRWRLSLLLLPAKNHGIHCSSETQARRGPPGDPIRACTRQHVLRRHRARPCGCMDGCMLHHLAWPCMCAIVRVRACACAGHTATTHTQHTHTHTLLLPPPSALPAADLAQLAARAPTLAARCLFCDGAAAAALPPPPTLPRAGYARGEGTGLIAS